MTTFDDQRRHIIRHAVLRRPEAIVEVSIDLWERLLVELTTLIGERGFASLYVRSLHLAGATHPALLEHACKAPPAARFADLRACLRSMDAGLAGEANIALLNAFTDILNLLIGELMTSNILRAAWGDDSTLAAEKAHTS